MNDNATALPPVAPDSCVEVFDEEGEVFQVVVDNRIAFTTTSRALAREYVERVEDAIDEAEEGAP